MRDTTWKYCAPSSHIVDSRFYSRGYTTQEACKIFCDRYRYQRWMEIEAALALTQAELGIIPEQAARAINDKARVEYLDLDAVQEGIAVTSHSLLPMLEAWQRVCDGQTGQFLHYGATTQDIQDTGQVLEIRDVLDIVERDLKEIARQIMALAQRHVNLVTIGRTHTQHASPMTLGLKMAVWLDEVWRNYERLMACRQRVLVSQLFGGVGTLDAFGKDGIVLLDRFSQRLGLRAPLTAWHAARDRGAEFLATMAMISGTFGKVANEIRCLARSETGELEEPFHHGKVGSSTMPHKRNPEMCEQVVVLARLIRTNAGLGFEGMVNEHERDYRAVRLEWVTVTDTSLFVCGLLSLMKAILKGLIVHESRIRENVRGAATLISTEALMFFLGETIGKQSAHRIIYEASMEAAESNRPLIDLLMERPEISGRFQKEDLEKTVDPVSHVGMSHQLTHRVISHVREKLRETRAHEGAERVCPLSDQDGHCCV
jgi:adenylosuccinate lyase